MIQSTESTSSTPDYGILTDYTYRDDDGRSVFVAGGPEGVTGTATADVVDGRITVDTPGATDIDIYVLPSGMLGLIAEVEPWGVDELGMERADQALAGLGWERTGDWAGEAAGQQWTAPVRPLHRG